MSMITAVLWVAACGGVILRPQGHIVLESYPTSARCEWTVQVGVDRTVELRWVTLGALSDITKGPFSWSWWTFHPWRVLPTLLVSVLWASIWKKHQKNWSISLFRHLDHISDNQTNEEESFLFCSAAASPSSVSSRTTAVDMITWRCATATAWARLWLDGSAGTGCPGQSGAPGAPCTSCSARTATTTLTASSWLFRSVQAGSVSAEGQVQTQSTSTEFPCLFIFRKTEKKTGWCMYEEHLIGRSAFWLFKPHWIIRHMKINKLSENPVSQTLKHVNSDGGHVTPIGIVWIERKLLKWNLNGKKGNASHFRCIIAVKTDFF